MNEKGEKKTPQVAVSRRALGGDAPIVISEVSDRCLYTGFFGTLDSSRMKKVTDTIMDVVNRNDNDLMIVDLSNIDVIDSTIADIGRCRIREHHYRKKLETRIAFTVSKARIEVGQNR